jgi:hypothetical protein
MREPRFRFPQRRILHAIGAKDTAATRSQAVAEALSAGKHTILMRVESGGHSRAAAVLEYNE